MENPPPPPRLRHRPLPPLPDDILIEILTKLPVKSRARFRSVSKSWKLLISAANKKLQPVMYGLFCKFPITRKFRFVSIPSAPHVASVPIDLSLTFLPPNTRPPLNLADCRNGLLLFTPRNLDLICICNPATKKWAHIPPPPSGTKKQLVLAFDPRRSENYHVVSIPCLHREAAGHDSNELDVFSSATREWAAIKRFFGPIFCGIARFGFSGGILYYLDPVTDDTIAVDVEGRFCWRVKRPVESSVAIVQHCFGQSGGILHYVTCTYANPNRAVSVWVLKNSWSNEYVLKHRNAYEAVVGRRSDGLVNPNGMAFHPDFDVLFISLQDELLAYDLLSRKVVKRGSLQVAGPLLPYTPYFSEDLEL